MIEPAPAVLLDTCAIIWFTAAGPMADAALAAIRHAGCSDGIWISPASAWEIGMLSRAGKGGGTGLRFLPDPKTWFSRVMAGPATRLAAFTPAIAIDASHLPGDFHADPADRMIVATARHLAMPIVTRDARIRAYAKCGHVSVIAC